VFFFFVTTFKVVSPQKIYRFKQNTRRIMCRYLRKQVMKVIWYYSRDNECVYEVPKSHRHTRINIFRLATTWWKVASTQLCLSSVHSREKCVITTLIDGFTNQETGNKKIRKSQFWHPRIQFHTAGFRECCVLKNITTFFR
jgi:hypothetical protein